MTQSTRHGRVQDVMPLENIVEGALPARWRVWRRRRDTEHP